jgi:hypothetical protein
MRANLGLTWARRKARSRQLVLGSPDDVLWLPFTVTRGPRKQAALDLESEEELISEVVRREKELAALVEELLHARAAHGVVAYLFSAPREVEGILVVRARNECIE